MNNPYQHTEPGEEPTLPDFSEDLRGMKIVVFALIQGVVFFAGIMLWVGGFKNEPFSDAGAVAWAGVGFGALMLVLSYVIPSAKERRGLDELSQQQHAKVSDYLGLYRGNLIIGCALAEGACFMNVLLYFIGGQLMNLGLVVVLVIRIAMHMPSQTRVARWLADNMAAGHGDAA